MVFQCNLFLTSNVTHKPIEINSPNLAHAWTKVDGENLLDNYFSIFFYYIRYKKK